MSRIRPFASNISRYSSPYGSIRTPNIQNKNVVNVNRYPQLDNRLQFLFDRFTPSELDYARSFYDRNSGSFDGRSSYGSGSSGGGGNGGPSGPYDLTEDEIASLFDRIDELETGSSNPQPAGSFDMSAFETGGGFGEEGEGDGGE